MIIIIIYGYNKRGSYNIIISISAGPTKESWIKELKLIPDGRTCEVLPSHSLDVAFSQKTRITYPDTSARFKDKGWSTYLHYFLATKVIFVFSLVASLGKYAFRIQNPCLFIDCSIENGIAVVYWRGREW